MKSESRIKSQLALLALSRLARLTDSSWFQPGHAFIRQIERVSVETLLSRIICAGTSARLVVRHSAEDGMGFHMLLSDIDLTAIIEREDDVPQILERYSFCYRVLPFIGEIEVYSVAESQILENLRQDPLTGVEFIRLLRKIQWVETRKPRPLDEYNAYKTERALNKAIERMAALAQVSSAMSCRKMGPSEPAPAVCAPDSIPASPQSDRTPRGQCW